MDGVEERRARLRDRLERICRGVHASRRSIPIVKAGDTAAGRLMGFLRGKEPAPTKRVFGEPLEDILDREGCAVPAVVAKLICFLVDTEMVATEKGIFRVAGLNSDVDTVALGLAQDPDYNLAHVPAAVEAAPQLLKKFLREMPRSVIPVDHYDALMAVAKGDPTTKTWAAPVQDVITKLGTRRQALLECLLVFLAYTATHASTHNMDATNLAIVFAPNVIRNDDHSPLEAMTDTSAITAMFAFMIARAEKWVYGPKKQEESGGACLAAIDAEITTEASKKTGLFGLLSTYAEGGPAYMQVQQSIQECTARLTQLQEQRAALDSPECPYCHEECANYQEHKKACTARQAYFDGLEKTATSVVQRDPEVEACSGTVAPPGDPLPERRNTAMREEAGQAKEAESVATEKKEGTGAAVVEEEVLRSDRDEARAHTAVLRLEKEALEKQARALQDALDAATTANSQSKSAKLAAAEREVQAAKEQHEALRRDLTAAQEECARLNEMNEYLGLMAEEELSRLNATMRDLTNERDDLKGERDELASLCDIYEKAARDLEGDVAREGAARAEIIKERDEAYAVCLELEKTLANYEGDQEATSSGAAQLRRLTDELDTAISTRDEAVDVCARLEERLAEVEEEAKKHVREKEELRAQCSRLEQSLIDVKRSMETSAKSAKSEEAQAALDKAELRKLRKENIELRQQRDIYAQQHREQLEKEASTKSSSEELISVRAALNAATADLADSRAALAREQKTAGELRAELEDYEETEVELIQTIEAQRLLLSGQRSAKAQ